MALPHLWYPGCVSFLWCKMTLNVTIEIFLLLYLGTAAVGPEIFHMQPLFLQMGTCRCWRIGSTDAGKRDVWWWQSMCREIPHLVLSPAPLLPPCLLCSINIWLAGLLPWQWQLCQADRLSANLTLLAHPCSHLPVLCCLLPAASLEEAAWSLGCC